jgi:hypothetical protein
MSDAKWHIRSGDLEGEAIAIDPEKAFLALLESESPTGLGRIYQAYKVNAAGKKAYGTTVYVSTEASLKRAGLWSS